MNPMILWILFVLFSNSIQLNLIQFQLISNFSSIFHSIDFQFQFNFIFYFNFQFQFQFLFQFPISISISIFVSIFFQFDSPFEFNSIFKFVFKICFQNSCNKYFLFQNSLWYLSSIFHNFDLICFASVISSWEL